MVTSSVLKDYISTPHTKGTSPFSQHKCAGSSHKAARFLMHTVPLPTIWKSFTQRFHSPKSSSHILLEPVVHTTAHMQYCGEGHAVVATSAFLCGLKRGGSPNRAPVQAQRQCDLGASRSTSALQGPLPLWVEAPDE